MVIPIVPRFQCESCGGHYNETTHSGAVYMHACAPIQHPKDPQRTLERKNRRDENLATDRYSRVTGIRAEGAGAKCLSHPNLDEPTWITRLKAQVEKEQEALNV